MAVPFDFGMKVVYTETIKTLIAMAIGTITKTKDFLVIKVPLKDLQKKREVNFVISEEDAVKEGLRAVAEGRVSREFKTVREAVSFLDSL